MSRIVGPAIFLVFGGVVLAASLFDMLPGELEVIGLGFGFLTIVAGMAFAVRTKLSGKSTGTESPTDRAGRIRLVLAAAVAGVVAGLPLARIPLRPDGAMATGLDIPQAMLAGNISLGVLATAAFIAVMLAAISLTIFHHVGGYVVILDAVGLAGIAWHLSSIEPMIIVFEVYGIGMYLGVVGGLAIVGTQFVSSEDGSRSSWSPSHQ